MREHDEAVKEEEERKRREREEKEQMEREEQEQQQREEQERQQREREQREEQERQDREQQDMSDDDYDYDYMMPSTDDMMPEMSLDGLSKAMNFTQDFASAYGDTFDSMLGMFCETEDCLKGMTANATDMASDVAEQQMPDISMITNMANMDALYDTVPEQTREQA